MISKSDKTEFRSSLFRHLDGIVTAPTAYALLEKGVIDHFRDHKKADLHELSRLFKANEGYLNVALRVLSSQGWLLQKADNQEDAIEYELTSKGEIGIQYFHWYKEAAELLKYSEKFHPRKFEKAPFLLLESLFQHFKENFGASISEDEEVQSVQHQILSHIEGIILGPTIVHLGMSGMFHKYFMEARFKPEEFHKDPTSFQRLLDIFVHFGWFLNKNDTYQFTEKGIFFAKRASAYGVTVSYIPTLRKLDDLIFGNPKVLKGDGSAGEEAHVDREMNVWGSGGAHANYFKIVDEIVIDLFNRPIQEQPKGVLDMGCGNGAFLQHLYNVIEKHTERGKMLDEYPLALVGVDYNETALKISKANLIQADIWAKVIWGDIGRPELLAVDLKENYDIELKDLLNVRTFLDHNRIWQEPQQTDANRVSKSSGAFAYEGQRISNNLVEDSLLEHLKKWEPFVKKFGLLIIELHTIPAALTAANLGATGATAYDATHGYSDQYILEEPVFKSVAAEAGLFPVQTYSRKFPNSELATVSINLFRN